MAITLDELQDRIESLDLRCQKADQIQSIMVGFKLEEESTYRDRDGDACLAIVLRLAEKGELLSAFVPACWTLGETAHRAAVAMVLLAVQSRFKFLRFDLADNMVVANVEVAIEDGTLSASQVQRIIGALLQAVQKFDVVIRKAIDTGDATVEDVEIAARADHAEEQGEADEESSSRQSNSLARLLELMDEAGGVGGGAIEALERLLGGDGLPPTDS